MHDLVYNEIAEKAKEENKPCTYFNNLFIQRIHLIWNCNIVHNVWFDVKNVLKNCVITLSMNARKITLGISKKYFENRNTVNYIWLISKYIQPM